MLLVRSSAQVSGIVKTVFKKKSQSYFYKLLTGLFFHCKPYINANCFQVSIFLADYIQKVNGLAVINEIGNSVVRGTEILITS